jgi:hypothetical protein
MLKVRKFILAELIIFLLNALKLIIPISLCLGKLLLQTLNGPPIGIGLCFIGILCSGVGIDERFYFVVLCDEQYREFLVLGV